MSLEDKKERLKQGFQSPYDICAMRTRNVRLPRVHSDLCLVNTEGRTDNCLQPYQSLDSVVAEIDSNHAAPALHECAKIPESLGLFQDAERVRLAGNREINLVVGDDLKEHARIRTTFVKLSSRMQEAWSITDSGCALGMIADLRSELLKLAIDRRCLFDVVEKCDVITRLDRL